MSHDNIKRKLEDTDIPNSDSLERLLKACKLPEDKALPTVTGAVHRIHTWYSAAKRAEDTVQASLMENQILACLEESGEPSHRMGVITLFGVSFAVEAFEVNVNSAGTFYVGNDDSLEEHFCVLAEAVTTEMSRNLQAVKLPGCPASYGWSVFIYPVGA